MSIEMVKVRALIDIGEGNLMAGTPPLGYSNNILSFNVDKSRGQISSFSASLKVRRDEVTGGILDDASVTIYAGTTSTYSRNKIFTGLIRTATVTPNRDDPEYVILNISGNDILVRLNGKKFTRRCRSSKGVWVGIDGVSREGLRDQTLSYEPTKKYIDTWGGELHNKDQDTSTRTPSAGAAAENIKEDYEEDEISLQVNLVN